MFAFATASASAACLNACSSIAKRRRTPGGVAPTRRVKFAAKTSSARRSASAGSPSPQAHADGHRARHHFCGADAQQHPAQCLRPCEPGGASGARALPRREWLQQGGHHPTAGQHAAQAPPVHLLQRRALRHLRQPRQLRLQVSRAAHAGAPPPAIHGYARGRHAAAARLQGLRRADGAKRRARPRRGARRAARAWRVGRGLRDVARLGPTGASLARTTALTLELTLTTDPPSPLPQASPSPLLPH
eukprot:scaffold91909_cov75-Phaeocystis_antarctica.AAC.4